MMHKKPAPGNASATAAAFARWASELPVRLAALPAAAYDQPGSVRVRTIIRGVHDARLSLLRVGLACFAFAAGYLVDANVGQIMQQGSVVQSAEAARYNRTVVRRPGGTYKRTVVRGPRGGVYKRTVVRGGGRVYPGVAARRVVRTGAYIGALPGGCARVNRYGYVVWRCGGIYYQPYGGRYAVVRF